ncbi:ATP phosphoribosyltransferase [Desulfococcaceae bacterium HSG8]|nr:ATP phosphoribosyltransferase [Desulfococcaceae bacterium HSG8]
MGGIPDKLNIALPDGHLMAHVLPFIKGAGLHFDGYETENLDRRPVMRTETETAKQLIIQPELVAAKVIRPQDMPTHVANANFDIAISGTDWLAEHRQRFPKSPVIEKLRLGFGQVRIVVAVHQDEGDDVADFIRSFRSQAKGEYLRIASEYVYLADYYAQRNNLHPYRVIMTYGATESLIPEDCDMIVENTETGNTLRKNRLKIIDTLEISGSPKSEGCLIASLESLEIPWKRGIIDGITSLFEMYLKSESQ